MTERALGQTTAPPDTAAVPLVGEPAKSLAHRKLGLRAALTGLVLLTVSATAILIHLTWFYAARRNVADVVGQLNRQIVGSVQHEVRATLNDAWSVQEAVRSIFFQEAIKPTDEAKREFIFLALLRSHPTVSWIALGFPDGAFFGALKAADDEIDMVEVKRNPETGIRQQRVDTYTPQPGDVLFRGREITPSDYQATAQAWYRRAVAEDGPGWSMLSHLPYRDRAAIVTSTPIVIDLDFSGVQRRGDQTVRRQNRDGCDERAGTALSVSRRPRGWQDRHRGPSRPEWPGSGVRGFGGNKAAASGRNAGTRHPRPRTRVRSSGSGPAISTRAPIATVIRRRCSS
jgi:hypothetical protein